MRTAIFKLDEEEKQLRSFEQTNVVRKRAYFVEPDRIPLQEQRRTLESQILAVQSLLSDMEGRVLSQKAAEDYTSGLKTLLWVCLETVQELSRGGAPWAASTGLLLRQLSAWVNDLASSAEDPSIIVRTLHAQCRAALRSTMGLSVRDDEIESKR